MQSTSHVDVSVSVVYSDCLSLAHRCAKVLIDLNDIMRDKWDTAPHSLLRNVKKYTE